MAQDFAKVSKRLWTGQLGRWLRQHPPAQALASYLLSGPQSNTIGLYRLPIGYALADLGWDRSTFEDAFEHLREFRRRGFDGASCAHAGRFLVYDEESEWVWIVDHARHTYEGGLKATDKRAIGIANSLEDRQGSAFVGDFCGEYGDHLSLRELLPEAASEDPRSPSEAPSKQREIEREIDPEIDPEEEHPQAPSRGKAPKKRKKSSGPTFDESGLEAAWQEWLEHRRSKRSAVKPGTPTWTRQVSQLRRLGVARAIAALEHSILQGWVGIFEPHEKPGRGRAAEVLQDGLGREPTRAPPPPDEPPNPYPDLTGDEWQQARGSDARDRSPEAIQRVRQANAWEKWDRHHGQSNAA